ncbi:hypothetical protein TNCV_3002041 [Trichonephila clavipes]|nr:hypothetical protein TNCV_3002041 [Trichonephila clavipes]
MRQRYKRQYDEEAASGLKVVVVPLRHGGTLNSRRAANPLVWLVEGPWTPPGFSPSKLGWNRAKSFCHLHSAQS